MIYVYVIFFLLLFLISFYYYFNKFRNSFEIKYNFLSKNDFEQLKVLLKEYKLMNDPRTNERKSICIMDEKILDLIYKYFRTSYTYVLLTLFQLHHLFLMYSY